MLFNFGQAKKALRRFVDNGSCRDEVLSERINEAVSRILDMADWRCCLQLVKIKVEGNCFALPQGVDKMLDVCIDGAPKRIYDHAYQFLSSGPGDLDFSNHSIYSNVIDDGIKCSMYDVPHCYRVGAADYTPEGMYLVARSMTGESADLVVSGVDTEGEAITDTVKVGAWDNGIQGAFEGLSLLASQSNHRFSEVHSVTKSPSSGYVTLLAYDPDTSFFSFLARYHTLGGVMGFRRYKVTGCGDCFCVLARIKAGHNSLVSDDDVVPVDSLPAIKAMLMSIRDEDAGNLQGAVQHEANARRLMEARETGSTMVRGTQFVMDVDYAGSLGPINSNGMIL